MTPEARDRLIRLAIRMLKCDSARIIETSYGYYLCIGHRRSTQDDPGQWVDQDGNLINWEYDVETTVASGKTETELRASIKAYYKLSRMKWSDYFRANKADKQFIQTLQALGL